LSLSSELFTAFQKETGVPLRRDILGARHTTFAIGGPLDYLIEPESEEDIAKALRFLNAHQINFRVLGAGSNLLISDTGISEWVIKAGKGLRYCHETGIGEFAIGASMSLMTLSRNLSIAGFSGIEFAGGIPASLGGAIKMNAGAHGGQMADCVEEVTVVHGDGEISRYSASEMGFSYRNSKLPTNSVVVEAKISLQQSSAEKTSALRAKFLAERKKRQPLTAPCAGSVFKNPSEHQSAGAVLEAAGLKGHVVGGAKVSELHANWIVNEKRTACYEDVVGLIKYCQKLALEKSGIELEPEIVHWESCD